MSRTPKLSIQGWTHEGPAYTIHRSLAGFSNRKRRRSGESADELVGDHEAATHDQPAAAMLYADGDREVWGFAAGHAYVVDLIVDDGDVVNTLVDAREDHRLETYADGMGFLSARVATEEEIGGDLEHPSNVSDGAESQEPAEVTTLTGAQTEEVPEQPAAPAPEDEPLEHVSAPMTGDEFLASLDAHEKSDDEDAAGGNGDPSSDEEE